jgi:tRNA pseudouridine13 synthase
LPYAHGGPTGSAVLRRIPEDFVVVERPVAGFVAAQGQGGHLALQVRKRALNTRDVVDRLAAWAGVGASDIGFAGLKDRHAVTSQWFTVPAAPRLEQRLVALGDEALSVLAWFRTARKLRRGELAGNAFRILLRDFAGDRADAETRLQQLRSEGVPNYFGPQRFGRGGSNLQALVRWREGGSGGGQGRRGLLLSSLRSYLFNLVLAERVADGSWNRLLDGEVVLDERGSARWAWEPTSADVERVRAGAWHPSGMLPGAPGPGLTPRGEAGRREAAVLQPWGEWIDFLTAAGVRQGRRALRLMPTALRWRWQGQDLLLEFELGAGGYATSVIRELATGA